MTKPAKSPRIAWHTVELGIEPDVAIAAKLGVSRVTVCVRRRSLGIPAARGGGDRRPWTEREEDKLAEVYWCHWTARGRADLARALGRSVQALRKRARRLELPARANAVRGERWPLPLATFARETGYEPWRIAGAARRAGVKLRRDGAHFAITEAQAKQLLAELAAYPDGMRLFQRRGKEWRPGQVCACCGKTRLPRMARELCSGCYMREQRSRRQGRAA